MKLIFIKEKHKIIIENFIKHLKSTMNHQIIYRSFHEHDTKNNYSHRCY